MTWFDYAAIFFFAASWVGYTLFADRQSKRKSSLMSDTHQWRKLWLENLLIRENRMLDIGIVNAVARSVLFFASTTMFVLAGLMAVLGSTDQAIDVASALPFARSLSTESWELALLLLITNFGYAFFKFTWAMRQFNYIAYMIGAAPIDAHQSPESRNFVAIASNICTLAHRHFNRGIRAYYFGLAMLTWFVHSSLFALSGLGVILILYYREFHSDTAAHLSQISSLSKPAVDSPINKV